MSHVVSGRPSTIRYTQQQKLAAILKMETLGIAGAARATGIGETTLKRWANNFTVDDAVQAGVADPDAALRGTIAKALAGLWPGHALRVCGAYLNPYRMTYRLVPRGQDLPAGAVRAQRFKLSDTDTTPARSSYSDGFLSVHAANLPVHRHFLDLVSVELAGNDQHAAEMIAVEITRRLGADMTEGEIRIANRAAHALRMAGFYDHASTDNQKATIAALVARDLRTTTTTDGE